MSQTIKIRTDHLEIARIAAGLNTNGALARAMGLDITSVGRTLTGKRAVSSDFIAGLRRAFPGLTFEHLLVIEDDAVEQVPA